MASASNSFRAHENNTGLKLKSDLSQNYQEAIPRKGLRKCEFRMSRNVKGQDMEVKGFKFFQVENRIYAHSSQTLI